MKQEIIDKVDEKLNDFKKMRINEEKNDKNDEAEIFLMEVIKDKETNEKTVILVGRKTSNEQPDEVKTALKMINTVQSLHLCGVLHRNLERRHFLLNPETRKMYLIDYSQGYIIEDDRPVLCSSAHSDYKECGKYRGSLSYAPFEVLEHLSGQRQAHI